MKAEMRAFVLGSGSSGNALLLEAGGTRILVDAGIGPRQATTRLASLGADLLGRGVDAILITHQHGDHIGGAERLSRALSAPVLLHPRIEAPRVRKKCDVREYDVGKAFRIGELEILAESVPHDAPQVALRFSTPVCSFGIATDVGHVTARLASLLATCDAAIIESNHCSEMLRDGRYPDFLKRRVAGGYGHLSNDRTAQLVRSLMGSRLGKVWLGHLSRANNTPERARETVAAAAPRMKVEVLPHGEVCAFEIRGTRPAQLALFAG
jgi:phosphoribosyl 1,2-cyclic phosphodiesterase